MKEYKEMKRDYPQIIGGRTGCEIIPDSESIIRELEYKLQVERELKEKYCTQAVELQQQLEKEKKTLKENYDAAHELNTKLEKEIIAAHGLFHTPLPIGGVEDGIDTTDWATVHRPEEDNMSGLIGVLRRQLLKARQKIKDKSKDNIRAEIVRRITELGAFTHLINTGRAKAEAFGQITQLQDIVDWMDKL